MGNYITTEILTRRVTQERLTALCSGAGNDSSVLIGEVIARAEALIDGYASTRYQTPLPANDLVMEWALNLAEFELYKRGPGGAVPEKIKESYRITLEHLKDLAAGKLQIASPAVIPSCGKGRSVIMTGQETLFGHDSMQGY